MKNVLLILLLSFSTAVWAQRSDFVWDTNGVALGSEATITLGDQLDLVYSFPLSKDASVEFPPLEAFGSEEILPLSRKVDTTVNPDGSLLLTDRITITCFSLGRHALLPMADSTKDSLFLTVLDVPNVDTTKAEIKDLAGNFREPYTFWEIFRWVLLAILIIAAGWGLFLLARKWKRKEPIVVRPQAPPLPPDQRALAALETLRKKELWQQGRHKEYHTELTDIVRQYLQEAFGIVSAEMTSDQTMEAFRYSSGWTQNRNDMLLKILRNADMEKFAKAELPTYLHDLSMEYAKQFVSASAPASSSEEAAHNE